jgi:hypothetical protein
MPAWDVNDYTAGLLGAIPAKAIGGIAVHLNYVIRSNPGSGDIRPGLQFWLCDMRKAFNC